jgi:hypothetical protein
MGGAGSGIGPITADPAHPFYNAVAADLSVSSTYRVADLSNEAAKNLMPWAVEALKKQNALVLANKNGETRLGRVGRPAFPTFTRHRGALFHPDANGSGVDPKGLPVIWRVYLNVPHSKTVSHIQRPVGYEGGDTLVVDTIGLNDLTFVDGYRTPYTTELHGGAPKITNDGKRLDVPFTVDDPGTFYHLWARGGRAIAWLLRMGASLPDQQQ